jgi:hypothetical protein
MHHGGDAILRVQGEAAAPATLLLPQFAFPGWSLSGTPMMAGLSPDAATGLLRLELPPGPVDLALRRVATGAERLGWALSGVALLAWLLLATLRPAVGWRSPCPHRAAPDPKPSARSPRSRRWR